VCLLAAWPAAAQRLDSTVVPSHYELAFDVDLAGARFSGQEVITVTLTQPSRRIVLHAVDIQFQEVKIVAGGVSQLATVALSSPTQTAALSVPRAVPAGSAEIHIRYTGILNNKLRGFYLSQANGRRYGVTQLESTDARRAFPSFDEPAFKATFSVSLTIESADTAISNGRLLSDTPAGPGRHTLTFAKTPRMSSYLVAIAVGDFRCLEGEADAVPIRVCATPDKRDLGQIALDAAKQIVTFYNRYYTIRYPFGKLDVVAVPDFAAGAMENTAAIFFREADLLADSRTVSVSGMQRIWSVLAHELAHQWFGDLVTMRWWDDLWLNEGFATWMEKRPLAAARPEWKIEIDEVADTQAAMNLDALRSTRAIHSAVETPDEIESSFDQIAYEKGAAVMRMIEGYVGAETFRKGVNAYLEKYAYSNATSADFWNVMSDASGHPVNRILPSFVNQPGVPLVDVTLSCASGKASVGLSTRRFFTDASGPATSAGAAWPLPVCLKTPARSSSCQIVSTTPATLPLEDTQCAPWVFINGGAHGYFRSAYSPATLRAMAPDIATRFTEAERLSLVGDEWALVRAGHHTIGDYLTLTTGFSQERASGIVAEIARRLEFAHDYLTTDRTREPFERFVRSLFGPMLDELGVGARQGDDDDRRALRATVIGTLGSTGNDTNIAATARAAVERAIDGGPQLDTSAADAIVRVAARRGDAKLWERFLAASRSATSPADRYRYLYALSAFEDRALIDRGLNFSLTSDLRSQDTPGFLGRYLANPTARGRAWAFIKQHWNELAPKITIALGDVRLVQALGSFCDASTREDIRSFFSVHRLPAAARALNQTIERINSCVAMKDKQTAPLASWLASRP
jgi:aminopeptidase N